MNVLSFAALNCITRYVLAFAVFMFFIENVLIWLNIISSRSEVEIGKMVKSNSRHGKDMFAYSPFDPPMYWCKESKTF